MSPHSKDFCIWALYWGCPCFGKQPIVGSRCLWRARRASTRKEAASIVWQLSTFFGSRKLGILLGGTYLGFRARFGDFGLGH